VLKSYGLLEELKHEQTAATMRETARPILDFGATKASGARRAAVLCSTQELKPNIGQVADSLKKTDVDRQHNRVGDMAELTTTDPYAFQFVRTVDAISLESVNRLWQGPSNQSARESYLNARARHVVFGAEVEAEKWEQERRIERDGMGSLTLHPLVVAALANPERARSYALALASDMIQQDRGARTVSLQIPGESQKYPLLPTDAPMSVDPLVMGLLIFSLQPPPAFLSQIAELERLLAEPTDEMLNHWNSAWVNSVPSAFRQGERDRQDLGIWVRLVVRYELAQRSGRS
jgi:hypothetical protein